jgi:rubrerythrin
VKLHTAAEVISFVRKLESESADFYNDLSQKYAQSGDVFLSFAKENGKNITQVERSYYGVITDAIEGCFSFNVEPDAYTFETKLDEKASYSDALGRAIEIEEKMIKLYSDAAEQSQTLMADVPRVFKIIARKRGNRVAELGSLLKR